jgi:GNAT superfamily N-acetyltransferase
MVLVRETVPADWRAWRDIRLLALRDAPDAFASTYAEQVALGGAYWRQRVADGGLFLAWIQEVSSPAASTVEPAGLAGGYQTVPGTVELISMFVRPQARGRGVGEALIDAVIGWARERDATSVHLWVTDQQARPPALRALRVLGDGRTPAAALQPGPRRGRHDPPAITRTPGSTALPTSKKAGRQAALT